MDDMKLVTTNQIVTRHKEIRGLVGSLWSKCFAWWQVPRPSLDISVIDLVNGSTSFLNGS